MTNWMLNSKNPRRHFYAALKSAEFQDVEAGIFFAGWLAIDRFEVGRRNDLQVFHVRRVAEQEMADTWALVDAVAGFHQGFLVLVHKPRPALEHDHDLEIRLMAVPAVPDSGALFALTRCAITFPCVALAYPRSSDCNQ